MFLKATSSAKLLIQFCSLLVTFFLTIGHAHGQPEVTHLTQEEMLTILKDTNGQDQYVLIDVRSPGEFKAGHIATAVNIPHHAILENISLLDPYIKKNMIFYCQSGRRVSIVTDLLKDLDYNNLYHLDGDFLGWQSSQLDIVK